MMENQGEKKQEPSSENSQAKAPSISLPKGGGAIRGIGEKFTANPVTGTGSLSVPIYTSPGRSNFGPQLSLSYDSGTGNSPFGFGWSLSIPSITRKTDKGLPQYNYASESDVFILSGAEDLVPVLMPDGNLFKDTTTVPGYIIHRYRPRIEGLFTRIERWTNQATGEIHWRSISRDNITTIYGKDNASRIFDQADSNPQYLTRIFGWLICQSYDDKGNAIIYEYAAENNDNVDGAQANECNRVSIANRYLKRIKYGNREPNRDTTTWQVTDPAQLPSDTWMFEVVLDYGEGHYVEDAPDDEGRIFTRAQIDPPAGSYWPARQDPFSTYRAGFEVRTYRLCRRAIMFHHFPQELGIADCLVRSTEFLYSESSIASFITSVTQSGYVRQPTDNQSNRYLKKSLPPLEFEYSRVPSSEQLAQQPIRDVDTESLENLPVGLDGASYQWMDLDGEGTSGILTEQADAWYYKRNISANHQITESGHEYTVALFAPTEVVASKPAVGLAGGAQFLDLAGDGQVDLVQMEGSVRGFYERTNEATWTPFQPFVSWPNLNTRDPDLRFVDLTGDGHADILITEGEVLTWYPSLAEDGFGPSVRVSLPLDEEKGPRLVFADSTQSIYLADLSGDGLSDLVRIRNGEVCYWPNLGYAHFGAKVTMDNAPWFDSIDQFDQRRIRLVDTDGSGTTDILYLRHDGIQIYFNQSGNCWSDAVVLPQFPPIDNISSVQALDLLGNGTACLVWSSPLPGNTRQPMRYIALMEEKPHLLVGVRNNLGAETKVHYAPSTKFYLDDKQAGKPWVTRLPFPVHVVERVETYDYISRNRFITRYAYHHGYFDGVEREFRGFGMVEQWDTEEIGTVVPGTTTADDANWDAASFVPPVLTRTWFHTGAYIEGGRTSKQFEHEYYREGDASRGEVGLTDQQLEAMLLDDTVLPVTIRLPDGTRIPYVLSGDEAREACRSLKGAILRQEIYGLDNTDKADRPYSVSERNYTIEVFQPQGQNRHAVFFTHACETVDFHYERKLFDIGGSQRADPRVTHALTLEVDNYGNVLQSVAIGYGRRFQDPSLTTNDQKKQTNKLVTWTENAYTKAVLGADAYRIPLLYESHTYEVLNLTLGPSEILPNITNLFRFDEVSKQIKKAGDGNHDLLYDDINHTKATTSDAYRRLIEHVRTLYRKNDLTGFSPLGTVESLALPGKSYKLAFTPNLLTTIYVDTGKLSTNDVNNVFGTNGGYVHSEGDTNWWIPSGTVFYSPTPNDPPALERAFARAHFFLPYRHRDPFGNEVIVTYDSNTVKPSMNHNLLLVETKDSLGNVVTVKTQDDNGNIATRNDYRVLQPYWITDPNGNRTQVAFDALGMVVGTAVMGKPGENKGDNLINFEAGLTQTQINSFHDAPDPHAIAANLLNGASTRIVYDLRRFYLSQQAHPKPKDLTQWDPPYAATLARETHTSDSKIQISFSYSDGFGREIQKKVQAEPGEVEVEDAAGNTTVVDTTPNLRWVGSGWTIFNNKGKPVRQYEPFFSTHHRFQFGKKVGMSPILFYDPIERVIATLHPNHTYEKVVFDPWRQVTYDVNDTVAPQGNETGDPRTDPDIKGYVAEYFKTQPPIWQTWYAQRQGGALGTLEQSAATKSAVHANTPTVAYFDTLGRTFLTFTDNGPDPAQPGKHLLFATCINLDIEGNQRKVIDARGRVVMRYDYHIAGPDEGKKDDASHRIHQNSMDAGERWMLHDVAGQPIRTWDSRNHEFSYKYDELRRPTEKRVKDGDGNTPLDNLYEKIIYGESKSLGGLTDKELNLRGKPFEHYDTAGNIRFEQYDFKGNLLKSHRRLTTDYKKVVHWDVADPELLLEANTFTVETEYDAMNRVTKSKTPDNSITTHLYNEASLLDKVHVLLEDNTQIQFVKKIHYNEKGQRKEITYGNNIKTTYEYDKETFRLMHLQTRKANGKLLQDLYYTYDPAGNITQIEDKARPTIFFNNFETEPVNEFTYDAIYRLTEAKGREHIAQVDFGKEDNWHDKAFRKQYSPGDQMTWRNYTQQYKYDAVGNIEQMKHAANGGSWTRDYEYEIPNNRLKATTVGNETYTYTHHPAHGFMTTMPHLQVMEWNFREELQTSAKQKVNNGTPETTYYVYDFDGQRVRKITENAADMNNEPTLKEERIYVGGIEIYKQHSGDNAGLERKTLHVMDDKSRIAMVETRNDVDDGSLKRLIRYQFSNHLGTTCLETDDSADPRVISYEEYHPYGTTSYQAVDKDIKAASKRYRYAGKERDEEMSFNYHGARYYAPWLCRWVSCDPVGVKQDLNPFTYTQNNPLRYIDPGGGQPEEWKCGHEAAREKTELREVRDEPFHMSPPIAKSTTQVQKSRALEIAPGTIFVPLDVSKYHPPVIGYKKMGRPYGVERIRGGNDLHHGTDVEGEKVQAMISGTVEKVHRRVAVQLSKTEKYYLWQWKNPNKEGWSFDTQTTKYKSLIARGLTSAKLHQRVKEADIREYEVYVTGRNEPRHSYHHLKTLDPSIRPGGSVTGGRSIIGELAKLGTVHLHIQIYLGEYFNPKLTYDPTPLMRALHNPRFMPSILNGVERITDIPDEPVDVIRQFK